MKRLLSFILLLFVGFSVAIAQVKIIPVADGWAGNTVNSAVFRKNSLVSYQNTQYIAFYDAEGDMVLGKRTIPEEEWTLEKTPYKGNVKDAHNVISIMADGDGYLHVAWDHHNNSLHYARSTQPGSLRLTQKLKMTGKNENKISYPEFYRLPGGDLLFFYRDGGSGNGNLVINRYNVQTKQWQNVQQNLIDGEGQRNPYWQACVDDQGNIHISWVWRESPDVASNHDLAYACSKDGGRSWQNSKGETYILPVTKATAEYAFRIPQNSNLINQTSMSCDEKGNPFIASYWNDSASGKPQYHVVYHIGKKWQEQLLDFRTGDFSLAGEGTKSIPVSRPQVLVKGKGKKASVLMIFRDEERGNRASVLFIPKIKSAVWKISDLTLQGLSSWEPTYDTELWRMQKMLCLFVQDTGQKDGEGLTSHPPTKVAVLEWKPEF